MSAMYPTHAVTAVTTYNILIISPTLLSCGLAIKPEEAIHQPLHVHLSVPISLLS